MPIEHCDECGAPENWEALIDQRFEMVEAIRYALVCGMMTKHVMTRLRNAIEVDGPER